MADGDSWDADSFDPDEPIKKASVHDKWEGEDEEEDVKDNWDDEEEEEEKSSEKLTEAPSTEKKKLSDKIKEKENLQRKKQEELQKRIEEESDESSEVKSEDRSEVKSEDNPEDKPEDEIAEKFNLKKLQEDSDLELANDTFGKSIPDDDEDGGVVSNHVAGIDAINPSSKDDFTEFEKLLKDKIMPYEKSIHYSSFLESLFRNVCLSLEAEDLKKINTSLTMLLSEKQKQEKLNKAKKKKKGIVPAGGLKAKKKDDLDDYGEFDGGYAQDYEDFM